VNNLFFEVPPLARDKLLTTLHPLLGNVLQTVDHFENSYLGAPFSWLEKPRNRMGQDLDCMADVLMGFSPIHFSQAQQRIQFRSRPMRFLGFSNHEKGAPRQEISKRSTVCSTFSRSGWSVVRSASLAKGDTSKKRPSPHLHKVPTRSNKVSPRTLQTCLVYNARSVNYLFLEYPCHFDWCSYYFLKKNWLTLLKLLTFVVKIDLLFFMVYIPTPHFPLKLHIPFYIYFSLASAPTGFISTCVLYVSSHSRVLCLANTITSKDDIKRKIYIGKFDKFSRFFGQIFIS
jgi:hypothetical protein